MCSSGNLSHFSIIDSTLLEGKQFATAYFTIAPKLQIAQALDDVGVEYIRYPISVMKTRSCLADTINEIELTLPAASK